MLKKIALLILPSILTLFIFYGCERWPTFLDTLPPQATLTAPADSAVVKDTVLISVTATDDKGVTKVDFYIDNQLLSSDNSSPYSFSWSTLIYQDSSFHSIFAIAYDAAGNFDSTQIITVRVVLDTGLLFVAQAATPTSAYSVFVSGNYAYVAEQGNGVEIFNVSNPASPAAVGAFSASNFTNGVFASGNYLYLADGANGMKVLDVSTPASPFLIGQNAPPGDAHEIVVSGNYAYVAAKGDGIYIINVVNPDTPTFVSSFATSFAWGVQVSGTLAYVTDAGSGLKIINVSNPASPSQTGAFSTGGDIFFRSYVINNYAYVAAKGSGIFVINVSNPASPSLAGSYSLGLGLANGIFVNGTTAYVAYGDEGLLILNVTVPGSISQLASFKTTGNAHNNLYYSNGFIYVASNSGLLVFRYNP